MLLAIAILAIVRPASATPTARLVYSRSSDAESCPDEPALRHAVAARIGYDPFFAWATRTVVANLTRRDGAFVASVDLVDEHGIAHGVRELHSSTGCGELLDAVALTIAIAIDSQSLAPTLPPPAPVPPVPPSAAPAPVEPEMAAPPPRETPIPPRPPTPRSMTLEASLGGVASVGVAPGPAALGLSLGVGLRWSRFSLGIEGRLDAPTGKAADGGGNVSSWLAVGSILPCAYAGPLLACAVAQGGSMQSSASGEPDTRSRQVGWWAAGGRVGVLQPLSSDLLLRLRADVVADLRPTTLELNGGGAWTAPGVAVSLGADALLRFP